MGRGSPIETAEDEVILSCWICQVFTLHYLLFDGNATMMLILSDGYWTAVTSDTLCDQTAIRIGKGVPKGMLRSADLVNECISHVQFLIEGKVSTQDKCMVLYHRNCTRRRQNNDKPWIS